MPELLRAYGEALEQDRAQTGVVLLGLALVTLALVGVFAGGVLVDGVERAVRRFFAHRSARR
jgi:hypothetical protein